MIQPSDPYPVADRTRELIYLKNFITNPNITVGDYTYYHDRENPEDFEKENVLFGLGARLTIGKFCALARDCRIILQDANHPMDGFSTYPFFVFQPDWSYEWKHDGSCHTIIGNDVWVGHRAMIMPDVIIGDGAIIGAGAVVTKSVAPYAIVAGNPARVIRHRFSDDIVRRLQAVAWWDWSQDKITRNLAAITGADIERLEAAE